MSNPGVRFSWRMQRTAQGTFADKVPVINRHGQEVAAFRYRVCMCQRGKQYAVEPVDVWVSPDHSRAEYRGLQSCGSVWVCPVCAPKIAAERRDEMHIALNLWITGRKLEQRNVERSDGKPRRTARGEGLERRRRERRADVWSDMQYTQSGEDRRQVDRRAGERRSMFRRCNVPPPLDSIGALKVHTPGHVGFVTLTFQHTKDKAGPGELRTVADALKAALASFKARREYKNLLASCGYRGEIKAQEVTYGEANGWHPHTHSIMLIAARALPRLQSLRKLWARHLIDHKLAGLQLGDTRAQQFTKLRHLLERCCVVQDGTRAAAYVAEFGMEPLTMAGGRWGPGSELTKPHMKFAHHTPDGLPRRCRHTSPWGLLADATEGDETSRALFREYGETYQGRRQLFWSPGLKQFLGIYSWDDDTLALAPDRRCTQHIIALTSSQWSSVLSHNARWHVLHLAATKGRDILERFLERLRARPPTHSGFFEEGSSWIPEPKAA